MKAMKTMKAGFENARLGATLRTILAAALAAAAGPALAAGDLGSMADGLSGQLPAVAELLGGFSYLAGAAFGMKGLVRLKEHSEDPRQHSLAGAGTRMAACALLFALPSLLQTLAETAWGKGAGMTKLKPALPVGVGTSAEGG